MAKTLIVAVFVHLFSISTVLCQLRAIRTFVGLADGHCGHFQLFEPSSDSEVCNMPTGGSLINCQSKVFCNCDSDPPQIEFTFYIPGSPPCSGPEFPGVLASTDDTCQEFETCTGLWRAEWGDPHAFEHACPECGSQKTENQTA
eukprot:182035_1